MLAFCWILNKLPIFITKINSYLHSFILKLTRNPGKKNMIFRMGETKKK